MTALLEVGRLRKAFAVGRRPVTGPLPARLAAWARGGGPPSLLHAVDDVSFTVAEGETVGLVGESGCGKSTLSRLITRLIDPSGGEIRFAGRSISDRPAAAFVRAPERKLIQMVFQDAGDSLNPRFTAFDAIADPLRRLTGLRDRAAVTRRVAALAAMAGLPPALLGRYPHQLSGGQKARVGIARAIAVEPRLVVLDEPTSALDVSVQVVILQLLQELKQRLGMSYLFVSHDLNVVQMFCDRVLVMYLGRIVESGPVAEVFRAPAHPYTRALLSAVPSADPELQRLRIRLDGEPQSPIDPAPTVCRFHSRCAKAQDRCVQVMPELAASGAGRAVACHFPEPPPAVTWPAAASGH